MGKTITQTDFTFDTDIPIKNHLGNDIRIALRGAKGTAFRENLETFMRHYHYNTYSAAIVAIVMNRTRRATKDSVKKRIEEYMDTSGIATYGGAVAAIVTSYLERRR